MPRASTPSSQPDLRLLERMAGMRVWLLAAAALIAGFVLLGWLVPRFGTLLPNAWALMKANSALCVLLCAGALALGETAATPVANRVAQSCAAVALLLALCALAEHGGGWLHGVSVLFASDASALRPGLMSVQTASYFALLSSVLLLERKGQPPRWVSVGQDVLGVSFLALTLLLLAGYGFGAARLVGQDAFTRTSPQTLSCMVLLCVAWSTRRSQIGLFSVLWGLGIGSRIARQSLPILLLLPFALVAAASYLTLIGEVAAPYAVAMTSAAFAVLLLMLGMLAARRINDLERDLRDMSLTDELTRVYNRRGFYLLGEHALLEAQRSGAPLSVLFLDLDGLKNVNDTHGHEVGSRFIADVADLLQETFRNCDVLGRIGGDEFAVVIHADEDGVQPSLQRLEQGRQRMASAGKPYELSYSLGVATALGTEEANFSELVDQADAQMYEAKRALRRERGQATQPAELAAA